MADDSRPLPESSDDLPRRVRGVNWQVPAQTSAAPGFARYQPPRPQASGQLPKRVPGTSAFRAAPRLARVRSLPVVLGEEESPPTGSMAPVRSGLAVTSRPPATLLPAPVQVPRAPAAARPSAQPPPARGEPQRKAARARARFWWLSGVLIVVLATAVALAATLHH